MRIFGLQRAHHRDGGIGFVMHAEHDLHRAGIILGEKAFQIARQVRLALMQRLEDGDGGLWRGALCGALHEAADQHGGQQRIAVPTSAMAAKHPADIRKKRIMSTF